MSTPTSAPVAAVVAWGLADEQLHAASRRQVLVARDTLPRGMSIEDAVACLAERLNRPLISAFFTVAENLIKQRAR